MADVLVTKADAWQVSLYPTPLSVSCDISQHTLTLPSLSVGALGWIDSLSLSLCFSKGIEGR